MIHGKWLQLMPVGIQSNSTDFHTEIHSFLIIVYFVFNRFIWRRTSFLRGHSSLDIYWNIPQKTQPGTYRIRHFGTSMNIFGRYRSFVGTSRSFAIY